MREQLKDPVFEEVSERTRKDHEISELAISEFCDTLNKLLENDNDFNVKHGFLALGRTMVYLTKTICNDSEHFESEMSKAEALAINKMLPSLMPTMKDGQIVEENFDMEDMSLRRVLMATGALVDYTFWRNELSRYSQTRQEVEAKEEVSE